MGRFLRFKGFEDPSYLHLYGQELEFPFFAALCLEASFFEVLPLSDRFLIPFPTSLGLPPSRYPVRFGWSWDGIAVQVHFPQKKFKPGLDGDLVELFIDTRDRKDSPFLTRFCHHFLFFPEPLQGVKGKEVTKFRGDETRPHADSLLLDVSYHSPWLSIFIPKEALHGYDPKQFDRLGFSYRISEEGKVPEQLIPAKEMATLPPLWASFDLKAGKD